VNDGTEIQGGIEIMTESKTAPMAMVTGAAGGIGQAICATGIIIPIDGGRLRV
jgi:hypothetical protein